MKNDQKLVLQSGSRVAVVGGGPAGSLCAYFLRQFAGRAERDITVDIFEPKDFWNPGPGGCNKCGGIISESLVQALAVEGIDLPDDVVQRGIDSYILHTEAGTCRIDAPVSEKRIAAVHRGGGPRTVHEGRWASFDAHLLKLAMASGANFYNAKVVDLCWDHGRPSVEIKEASLESYDLLVGAVGTNSAELGLFEKLNFGYRRPKRAKTYITELSFALDSVGSVLGDSMHIFLLDVQRLDIAALIPKGDFATLCMIGRDIDGDLTDSFFAHPEVRRCLRQDARPYANACHCSPLMYFGDGVNVFSDRVVMIGDCGVSRMYKDGIGGAYRTAKAAARTAVFDGVSKADFQSSYHPECRTIRRDNLYGRIIFDCGSLIKKLGFPADAVVRSVRAEQAGGGQTRMSMVMWDCFTGSAPYGNILLRTLHPALAIQTLVRTAFAAALAIPKALGLVKVPPAPEEEPVLLERNRARTASTGVERSDLGKTYSDGETIIMQGGLGDRMFVVMSGTVEVVCCTETDSVRVALLETGDVFGEMALLERETRSATVRAVGRARVLSVDRAGFLRRVHQDPSVVYRMLQQMSGRLREMDRELTKLRRLVRETED